MEFFGPGVVQLSIADRATIANMCPEYGATVGYFPVDDTSIGYLRQTNRDPKRLKYIEAYLKASRMYRNYSDPNQDPVFSQVQLLLLLLLLLLLCFISFFCVLPCPISRWLSSI